MRRNLSRRALVKFAALACMVLLIGSGKARAELDPENTIVMELKDGKVVMELLPDLAPLHVERFKELTRDGFYDGVVFHRVIDGFMAQTGDPTGTGRGGSEKPDLRAEFSQEPFLRGTLGMARSQNPDSANSQWFITFDDARHLDRNYTVFGRVVEGMELVDMIKKAPSGSSSGMVDDPDKIITMRVMADVQD